VRLGLTIIFWWLPLVVVLGLRYGLALSWWEAVPVGIIGYLAVLWTIFVISSKWEDHNLRRRGLPLLNDRWPDD
jgi:hypothetical protein